jgi:hypothetical protein
MPPRIAFNLWPWIEPYRIDFGPPEVPQDPWHAGSGSQRGRSPWPRPSVYLPSAPPSPPSSPSGLNGSRSVIVRRADHLSPVGWCASHMMRPTPPSHNCISRVPSVSTGGTRQAIMIGRVAWRSTNRLPCGCTTPHEPRVGLAGMGGDLVTTAFRSGASAEDSSAERAAVAEWA